LKRVSEDDDWEEERFQLSTTYLYCASTFQFHLLMSRVSADESKVDHIKPMRIAFIHPDLGIGESRGVE